MFEGLEYSIVATEVNLPGTISFTMATESNRNKTTDAVYNMFAMPIAPSMLGINSEIIPDNVFPPQLYIADSGDTVIATVEMISKTNLTTATELCKALGGSSSASKIYDLQLLPYCPMELPIRWQGSYYKYLATSALTENQDFQWIKNTNGDVKGIIFYPDKANFSKNIPLEIRNESVYNE